MVDKFLTALFTLAEHCYFDALKSRMIRDRLMVGLKDKGISESLQLDVVLTLETAIGKLIKMKQCIYNKICFI